MKRLLLALGLALSHSSFAAAQNYSAEQLSQRTVERCAVEAFIWGMPAANFEIFPSSGSGSITQPPGDGVRWLSLSRARGLAGPGFVAMVVGPCSGA